MRNVIRRFLMRNRFIEIGFISSFQFDSQKFSFLHHSTSGFDSFKLLTVPMLHGNHKLVEYFVHFEFKAQKHSFKHSPLSKHKKTPISSQNHLSSTRTSNRKLKRNE